MKKLIFILGLSILMYACNNHNSISLEIIDNVKKVVATKIEIKDIKKNEYGVICFYDTIHKNTYSNAIALKPSDRKDIDVIYNSLSSDKISFDYDLNSVHILGNDKLFLVIDNEEGDKILNEYKGNSKIIKMDQLSYLRNRKFEKRSTITIKEASEDIIDGIFRTDIGGGGGDCPSGGPGAISCSVSGAWGSCATSCSAGYYACCGPQYCKCVTAQWPPKGKD